MKLKIFKEKWELAVMRDTRVIDWFGVQNKRMQSVGPIRSFFLRLFGGS